MKKIWMLLIVAISSMSLHAAGPKKSKQCGNLNSWVYFEAWEDEGQLDLFRPHDIDPADPVSGWYLKSSMVNGLPKPGAQPLKNPNTIKQLANAAQRKAIDDARKQQEIAAYCEKKENERERAAARAAIYPPTKPSKKK